ncbi:MAG: DUF3575 domain-containing protein [Prolixibacteraceae bacterium]|nr:DUF3575 domain-containing protein [Prolixibacteraceae bacterium]
MKTVKQTIACLLFLFLSLIAFSQKNIIKTNAPGWTWGKFNAQYERMLTDYSSASVSYSFIRPYFAQVKELGLLFSTFDVMKARFNGHEVVLDYRLYNKNQPGPRGFYVGPYIRYTYLGLFYEVNNIFEPVPGQAAYDDFIREGIDLARIGLGIKLGAHWVIGDHFSIDWSFLGFGADYYTFRQYFEGRASVAGLEYAYQDETATRFFLSGIATDLTLGWAF